MSSHPFFSKIDWKFSNGKGDHLPFLSLSIRRVKELISPGSAAAKVIDGQAQFDESTFGGLTGTGTHLTPEEFHNGNVKHFSTWRMLFVLNVSSILIICMMYMNICT